MSSVNANDNGLRAIPPWTRSASDLRGGSSSPRLRSITPGPPQQQQQQGASLTVDAAQHAGDDDHVFTGASGDGNGEPSGSGGVSASSAVRYDAW